MFLTLVRCQRRGTPGLPQLSKMRSGRHTLPKCRVLVDRRRLRNNFPLREAAFAVIEAASGSDVRSGEDHEKKGK